MNKRLMKLAGLLKEDINPYEDSKIEPVVNEITDRVIESIRWDIKQLFAGKELKYLEVGDTKNKSNREKLDMFKKASSKDPFYVIRKLTAIADSFDEDGPDDDSNEGYGPDSFMELGKEDKMDVLEEVEQNVIRFISNL